jgi:two-component system sensor kinase FixL
MTPFDVDLSALAMRARGRPVARALDISSSAALAEELSLLIDGATTYAIYMLDPQGCVTIWNRGAERIKGWTEDEVVGQNFARFYPPDDVAARKPERDLARASLAGRFEEESWRLRKDGSEFLADVTITALRDDAGALRGFAKVIRDITDRKAAEAAVARREHHLRSILETIPDGLIVTNETGTISSFSAAAERLFGYTQSEVVGRNIDLLLTDAQTLVFDRRGAGSSAPSSPHTFSEIEVGHGMRRDGETVPVELAVGEVSIGGERIFSLFVRDVTKRQATERRVSDLQSELIHVSRVSAMGTMASTLAHEINQPLTAIANYLETARAMIDDADERDLGAFAEAVDLATAQSLRAGTIIRRLRAFVERGDTGFRSERLNQVVEEATSLALLGAHEAGVKAVMTMVAAVDRVLIDRVQVQQVIVNLVRNAIQAMSESALKELTIATLQDRHGWVQVTVADTGAGLDPKIRGRLFDAFATTKEDGMGLGLSICRTIIEAHGGRIWAEGASSGGTAFHFCLPLATVDE